MVQRFRNRKGRLIPKIGVTKSGSTYWPNGASYQKWKYVHPASVRVFAEAWGVDLASLSQPAKTELKNLYQQDVDSQTALQTVITKFGVPAAVVPTTIPTSPSLSSTAPSSTVKEYYLEYHDPYVNSHKWYAGLGVNDKYVTAHGRVTGYNRAQSISISNPVSETLPNTWAKMSKTEAKKLKKGYTPAGNPVNTIPPQFRTKMLKALGITTPPISIPAAAVSQSTPSVAPPKPTVSPPPPTISSGSSPFGGLSVAPPPTPSATPTPPPTPIPITAMTALAYNKHGASINFPAIVQRKLDGVRCLAWMDKGDVVMMSRQKNPFPDLDHIRQEIKALNLPPNIVLDGELYAHTDKMSFQKLAGLVRRHSHDPSDLATVQQIEYHVYDMIDLNDRQKDFIDRYAYLEKTIGGSNPTYLAVVENFDVNSLAEADKLHDQFVKEGFEGLMFRNTHSPYEGKRSSNLQKYKKFNDEEFEIVGYEEASGKDAGTVIWVLETPTGDQFRARPKGTMAERTTMFQNAPSYIGKQMTVQYFGLTDAGIPRFPIAIALRDYE